MNLVGSDGCELSPSRIFGTTTTLLAVLLRAQIKNLTYFQYREAINECFLTEPEDQKRKGGMFC